MNRRLPTPTAKPRFVLLAAVLLAVAAALVLLPGGAANAQTPAPAVTEAPVVTATAAGAHAVGLSWTAVPGAVRYELWTWTDAGGWRRLDDGSLTATTYSHGGLSAGASHWYAVRGVDSGGRSGPWSEYVAATGNGTQNPASTHTATPAHTAAPASTPTSTPTSPPGPTPTATPTAVPGAVPTAPGLTVAATTGGILLTWDAVPHAVRYELWTWWDAGVGWQPIGGANLTGTSWTHADVTAGTTYYYSIRALNASGEASAWLEPYPSATALAVTGAGTPTPTATATPTATPTPPAASGTATPTSTATPTGTPAAPAGAVPSTPRLTAAATTGGILLTWQAVAHAARYELWTWWDAGVGWQPVGGANLTGTTWTHTDVTAGTTYYYSIRAVNAAGEASAWLEPYPSATAPAHAGGVTPTPTATATATSTVTPTPGDRPTAAVTERGALIALYEATDGASWTRRDNWLSDKPLGSWYGVTADANGRVTGLKLRSNGLNGRVPDLGALTELTELDLAHNHFPGPFPDLGGLAGLTRLHLQYNEISGRIPDLSGLVRLRSLNLSYNELTGPIPPALGDLADLYSLVLKGNRLSGCIPALLRYVRDNDLDRLGLPDCAAPAPGPEPTAATTERGALVALYEATNGGNWKRRDNWLSDKPLGSWYGVTAGANGRVTALNLAGNGLSGEIPDLNALAGLEFLSLAGNGLRGEIPELNALAVLWSLVLRDNRLSGEIPDLSGLVSLEGLYLDNNRLSGRIPDLSGLANLVNLELWDNRLSGPVPDLSAAVKMRTLDLGDNELTGPFPDLCALTALEIVHLDGNRLSGALPDLCALPALFTLDLRDNDFAGPFPDLNALSLLRFLDLGDNGLSGPLPDLSAHTALRDLILDGNELSGSVPDLGALANLTVLDLGGNDLSGPLPDLSALTALERVILDRNRLSGPVVDLDFLTELIVLELAHNELSGPLPDLRDLARLSRLSLESNRFCLPAGVSPSHAYIHVDAHLKSLNLPACTAADLAAFPAAPQNLAATVGAGRVELSWDAVAHAAGYELRVWDSLDRAWEPLGGLLTGRGYAHEVLTDGRNYYYRVRARDGNGVRGPWSARAQAVVVAQRWPPPPPSLGLHIIYQKYLEVGNVVVAAPSEVSDAKMTLAHGILSGMLSRKPDLLTALPAGYLRIAIFRDNETGRELTQLPEFEIRTGDTGGLVVLTPAGWVAGVPEEDADCDAFIHEFAHLVQFGIEKQPGGRAFSVRLQGLYDAAIAAGLWQGEYASKNEREYWAETVAFWFQETLKSPLRHTYPTLPDYDPDVAALISEIFGGSTAVPAECKPRRAR